MKLKWMGLALVAFSGLAQSQTEKTSTPKFEVTSVKPNKSPDLSKALIQFLPSGRFVATNIALITGLMTEARLLTMRLMLQALLEDRFELTVRREPKEQPVYALVVGKGGPKLEKSKFQEQACGDTGPKWLSNPACHFLDGGQDRGLHGASVTIAQIVEFVQNFTDRPLFDKTGLTGFYEIQTEGWAPMRVNSDGAPQSGDPSANNSDRPTLFNVFEKLGLHLESQRAVIDMFVIDHLEKPSEN